MESKECTGMLFAFLLGIPSAMGDCIFGHEDGKPKAECRVSNGAAVGIIAAIIGVFLLVVVIAVIIVLCRVTKCSWNMGCLSGCAECG